MKDPSKYLWEMVSIAEGLKKDPNDKRWKLREGVKLFGPKQEAKCPHCNEWIQANRVWIVDEANKELIGAWKVDGTRIVASYDPRNIDHTIIHPHAAFRGHICMGSGDTKLHSASDALFYGVNTGFHYYSSELWFEQLGHRCPNVGRLPCELCKEGQLPDFIVEYGFHGDHRLCSKRCLRVAETFRCQMCFSVRDIYEPKDNRDLCEDCYDRETFKCDFCPGRVFKGHERYSDDKIVCESCRWKEWGRCENCLENYRHGELDHQLLCENCGDSDSQCDCRWCHFDRNERQCERCDSWFDRDALVDGICENCV